MWLLIPENRFDYKYYFVCIPSSDSVCVFEIVLYNRKSTCLDYEVMLFTVLG